MRRLFTPFGLGVLACLVLAGWALWSGGLLDGPVARQVRTSSVYAAPGTGLDRAAAERVIGNRRLVVVLMPSGADLRDTCHDVQRAADGTLVLVLSRDDDDFDRYGCASFGGEFGKSFVSEQQIGEGIGGFADRPLDAVKVIAVTYDRLVRAGIVPDGARTVSPSLPRFLVAAAALLAVLLGSTFVYLAGRRAGRLAAGREAGRAAAADARTDLNARLAEVARQIVEMDGQRRDPAAERKFRRLAADYAQLLEDPGRNLERRVDALARRCRALREPSPTR